MMRQKTKLEFRFDKGFAPFTDFAWSLIASIVSVFCQWLVIVLLTHKTNSFQLGAYSLAVAIAGPISMLTRLNMRTVLTTDVASQYQFSDYFVTRCILVTCGVFFTLIYALFLGGSADLSFIVIGVAIYKAVESVADVLYGLLQRQGRLDQVGLSTILRGLFLLASLWMGIALFNEVFFGILLAVVSWLAILLFYDVPSASGCDVVWFSFDFKRMSRLIFLCLPTGFVMMLASLNVNIPIYEIQRLMGLNQVAHYSSVAYLYAAGGLLASAVSQTYASRMAISYSNDRRSFWQLLHKLLMISVLLVALGLLLVHQYGTVVLSHIYGADYSADDGLLFWIAVATGLSIPSALYGLALTISRLFYHELILTLISIFGVWLSARYLVPEVGIVGGAIALTVGIAIRVIASCIILYTYIGRHNVHG